MNPSSWLLLLYSLPAKRGAERLSLWRQLKKLGALSLKTSAYLLPDTPAHYERLQWIAGQARDGGGEATLIRVTEIEGLGPKEIIRLFNEARGEDYAALIDSLHVTLEAGKAKSRGEPATVELDKLSARFAEIRRIDFFDSPRAQDAQMLLQRAGRQRGVKTKDNPRLSKKDFQGKTWLTRPRPEVDRAGSAWLIRRFIDPKARFVFGTTPARHRAAIPYDMFEAEFSHHGEDCTFETLLKRFGFTGDKALVALAEIVHDADLEDGKFGRTEGLGIDLALKGWARLGLSDDELLSRGAQCFEALYEVLRKG